MGDILRDKRSSCGLLNAVFRRRSLRSRRSTSSRSVTVPNADNFAKAPSMPKRRKSTSEESAFVVNPTKSIEPRIQEQELAKIAPPPQPKIPPVQSSMKALQKQHNYAAVAYVHRGRKVPKDAVGISGELESMIHDHQNNKGSSTLVRASSSNFMLVGNLGNLRQPAFEGSEGGGGAGGNVNSYSKSNLSKTNNSYPNSVIGNVVKKQASRDSQTVQTGSLCRALSTRMDPEQLKIMGNEDYKNGNFAEALALYDAAISIDPDKASYRSNKSAALTALGRLLEAVFECKEAIKIEPTYHRAHHRLANLYLRLGEAENAIYHYKHAGPEADQVDLEKAKSVQVHLHKCTEARRLRDWNTLIKETRSAISTGADSAPQIYAFQAEALMKLHRHQEAEEALMNCPNFEVEECTKFFGPIGNANLLMVRAQVDMAMGRFDESLNKAQLATRFDSTNKDANNVLRRARAVASARSNGNQLFKASKFYEACVAYGEGLEHDPYNSVLLYNRAASRSKLGQYEKAVEDCNAALNVRPGYAKARLRRADCNAKLGKWEASTQDYETLQNEAPEDGEVRQGLAEARARLTKQRGE